jgi:G patch domain and KOW motifs-containing protein
MIGEKRDKDGSKITFGFSASKRRKTEDKPALVTDPDEVVDDEPARELITSISNNEIITLEPQKQSNKPIVIPLPPDRNTRSQDHLNLAKIARGELIEEPEETVPVTTEEDAIMTEANQNLPLLLRNRMRELDQIQDEDQRFRADVESRPDAARLEDYENIPIEKFGEALMRGMGWTPGAKVGLNGRGLIKPVEVVPRPRGLGLGALPEQLAKKKAAEAVESQPPAPAAKSSEPTPKSKTSAPPVKSKSSHSPSRSSTRTNRDRTDRSQTTREHKSHSQSSSERRTWMQPGIIVRVVSKSLRNGDLYCERVQIADVLSNDQCSIIVKSGKIIEGVRESMIETALPKVGGTVRVLTGRNRGRNGILQERNSKQNKAVVQHEDDNLVCSYPFEQIAEYVGM